MNRRFFIKDISAAAIALSSAGAAFAMGEKGSGDDYGVSATKQDRLTHIGKRTLSRAMGGRRIFLRNGINSTLIM